MRENPTSGTVWGAPGNRRSYHNGVYKEGEQMIKLFLYAAIFGFTCWMISEVFEIVHGGYSPTVYYLTSVYHFFAGVGIWGLYKRQTLNKNTFNTVSTAITSIAYIGLTLFPVDVMNSGLSIIDFVNSNPIYKVGGFIWFIGMIMFSISVIRTTFFPKWTGIVMLIGTIIFMVTPLLGWPVLLVNINNIIFAATVIYISFNNLKTPNKIRHRSVAPASKI